MVNPKWYTGIDWYRNIRFTSQTGTASDTSLNSLEKIEEKMSLCVV